MSKEAYELSIGCKETFTAAVVSVLEELSAENKAKVVSVASVGADVGSICTVILQPSGEALAKFIAELNAIGTATLLRTILSLSIARTGLHPDVFKEYILIPAVASFNIFSSDKRSDEQVLGDMLEKTPEVLMVLLLESMGRIRVGK